MTKREMKFGLIQLVLVAFLVALCCLEPDANKIILAILLMELELGVLWGMLRAAE